MDQHGFQTITATDHRAWLWVVSLLSVVYSSLCFGARITAKWNLLSYDDAILGGGYEMLAIVHYGLLFKALYAGLGASMLLLTTEQMSTAAHYYFASRTPYFAALCLSKVSVLVFARRIFSGDIYKEKIFFAVAYTLTAVYGACGVLLSSAGCRPNHVLDLGVDSICDANTSRWAIMTAFDAITEFVILALPIWFISKNQIKASKKRIVVFVFSFRLLNAAFSIATTVAYFEYLTGSEPNIGIAPTVVWQESLLCCSLISASVPCLRSFLWAFMSTGLMTAYGNNTTVRSQYVSGSHPSPGNSRIQSQSQGDRRATQSRLRPDFHGYNVDVRSTTASNRKGEGLRAGAKNSFDSHGSEQFIIHQTTEFAIERA